jgi:hypothetical protein
VHVSHRRFASTAVTIAGVFLAWVSCAAQTVSTAVTTAPLTMNEVVDRAIARERALMHMLKTRTPLIETYLQDVRFDPEAGPVPIRDHYFLGRMDFGETIDRRDYLPRKGGFQRILLGGFTRLYTIRYNPLGFSWMIFADLNDFNRETYQFKFARREFLGDVRCLVFDVIPRQGTGSTRFHGRIWVEDQDYNIVRLNGVYEPQPRNAYFFHMDSWRLNLVPGYWVPTYVYSEEGDSSDGSKDEIAFKAQTRLWGYDLRAHTKDGEFTEILVDPMDSMVKDRSPLAQDPSPLEAQRQWMQQAADNVTERLQNAGLLAPEGELDKVLETVVTNLMITNSLDLQSPVHVRVMLTSPLETFNVGHTIIVSRGLIDVLSDETSLAAVLAHELAHIVLGHNQGSKYAFSDRLLFSDESTYRNLGFRHGPEEEADADKKAVDLLKNSPYERNLATAGLFLRQVAELGPVLAALCTPHLGNSFVDNKGRVVRMVGLMNSAPALDQNKLDQTAALPLGGRVKINAWDDRVELTKTKPAVITSARDKMPLEVTPFSPHLTRYGSTANPTTASAAKASNE